MMKNLNRLTLFKGGRDQQPRKDRKLPLASHPSFIIFYVFPSNKKRRKYLLPDSGHTPSLHEHGTIAVGTENGGWASTVNGAS